MSRARIRPTKGLKVPVPGRPKKPLAPAGESVELDSYWRRRLAAGEVVQVEQLDSVQAMKRTKKEG